MDKVDVSPACSDEANGWVTLTMLMRRGSACTRVRPRTLALWCTLAGNNTRAITIAIAIRKGGTRNAEKT